jgi:pimeloyl-ACP methyl ester carboxylesterase
MRTLYDLLSNSASFGAIDQIKRPAALPPVYLFWGRSNRVLPVKSGEELCRKLQPDRFEIFEGGGHLLMREQPELISKRIESFLAHVGARQDVVVAAS